MQEYPLIAGLYSDVDVRNSSNGAVWFRSVIADETNPASNPNDREVLSKAKADVRQHFSDDQFQPTEVFVVTWDQVGSFDKDSSKVSFKQSSNKLDNLRQYCSAHHIFFFTDQHFSSGDCKRRPCVLFDSVVPKR